MKICAAQTRLIKGNIPANIENHSMVLFQPYKERELYSKKYLHSDEKKFFVSGQNLNNLKYKDTNIALAICYEISIPEHAEMAFQSGAQIYLSSVAKFVNGIDTASTRLSYIARKNSMTVAMSNCIGRFDGDECAGRTSIWNNQGFLAGQLGDKNEGILIFDTESEELIKSTF